LSRADRAERGRRLCRIIGERIGAFASPGLGHDDRAWEAVAGASERFLDLLDRWERSGHPRDEAALEAAGKHLIRAWHQADQDFRRGTRDAEDRVATPLARRA
jgi:hypothetical protein